jgi:drug/metabolite transporter (DMT)-like permease
MTGNFSAVFYAVLAASCYGISMPVSKLLLAGIPPVFMAGLVYSGAGLGMLAINIFKKKSAALDEAKITKKELPYTAAMVLLDVLAPVFLMIGLSVSTPATASLLNNFEIAATSAIAMLVFKEALGRRTWLAVIFITIASVILSVDDISSVSFSFGSIFVLLACLCWGFENNCTGRLSLKDPSEIVIIKGIGSGFTSLAAAFIVKQYSRDIIYILAALLLGFVSYGLSVYFYIYAQRHLGAARTSAYYALAPFIGAALSFVIFREIPTVSYLAALGIMIAGVYFTAFEKHKHPHTYQFAEHEHRHRHDDGHHGHIHETPVTGEHSHPHIHTAMEHDHPHTPDLHHLHGH